MATTLLIAGDRAVFLPQVRRALADHPAIQVVGEASDGLGVLREVRRLAPDVVLMDLAIPGADGAEGARQLLAQMPAERIVVSTAEDDVALLSALYAGARGCLLDTVDPDQIVGAVKAVAAGHAYLSPKMTVRFLQCIGELPAGARPLLAVVDPLLQERDLAILRLIADGKSNREIGEQLYLSENTVRTYLTEILAKLGLENRVQLAMYAIRSKVA
jgi:DNA-binding NarL/FixJ family response regulator